MEKLSIKGKKMKALGLGILLGVLLIGVGWLINAQSNAFASKRAFMTQCEATNGVLSDSQSGWVHEMMICSHPNLATSSSI